MTKSDIREAITDLSSEIKLHYSEPDEYTTEGYRKISTSMRLALSVLDHTLKYGLAVGEKDIESMFWAYEGPKNVAKGYAQWVKWVASALVKKQKEMMK